MQGVPTRTFPGAAPKKPQRESGDKSLPGSQSMKSHSRNCPAIFTYLVPEGSNQHPVRWGREEEGGKMKTPHLDLCWQETILSIGKNTLNSVQKIGLDSLSIRHCSLN